MLRYKTETRPGLVVLYDIRPGNGAGPFLQPRSRGTCWWCAQVRGDYRRMSLCLNRLPSPLPVSRPAWWCVYVWGDARLMANLGGVDRPWVLTLVVFHRSATARGDWDWESWESVCRDPDTGWEDTVRTKHFSIVIFFSRHAESDWKSKRLT